MGNSLKQRGYSLVSGSDYNAGPSGGPVVSLYWQVGTMPSAPPLAITDVRLVNQTDMDSGALAAHGFEVNPGNLLEQSGRGVIRIAVKRGSGPPLVNLAVEPPTNWQANGWNVTTASTYDQSGNVLATASLYYLTSSDKALARTVSWTPCAGSPSQVPAPPPPPRHLFDHLCVLARVSWDPPVWCVGTWRQSNGWCVG